ncbi:uncharacterized protein LOC144645456 [Oculina patagonica]
MKFLQHKVAKMRRTLSCDSGKLVLPRIYGGDLNIPITGMNSSSPREEKDKKKNMAQGRLIRGNTRDKLQVKINEPVDIPKLTLPPIPLRNGPVNNEENKRRRRIHCYDFSLQVQRVIPEQGKSKKSSTSTTGYQGLDVPAKRLPYVMYDQNYAGYSRGEKSDLRDKRNFLPLPCGILQGQRINLLEKEQLNKQRKRYKPSEAARRKKHQGQPLMWFF